METQYNFNPVIQFRDLQRQYMHMKNSIDKAVAEVISSAHFISGPQIKELEDTLAEYVGAKHCITCANGTDAISIALIANGIGEWGGGNKTDAVFVPDFTFFSSGECPAAVGAIPIFVDVSPITYNIDADSLVRSIELVLSEGKLTPRAVVAVDLFGLPFDYEAVRQVCDRYKLLLLEDAAQGFGGSYIDYKGVFGETGRIYKTGNLGDISTTSFFPAKPLGCYGDGGAIFTNNDDVATQCRSIAVHGKDMENPDDPNAKYNNIRLGMNSRLDTLQAGILLAKFPVFINEELENVNRIAKKYSEILNDVEGLTIPTVLDGYYSSWAQYTIQLTMAFDRTKIQATLKEHNIPTSIYYMKPMHRQKAFSDTRSSVATAPVTEKLCKTVLCLPMHPYLEDNEVEYICNELKKALL